MDKNYELDCNHPLSIQRHGKQCDGLEINLTNPILNERILSQDLIDEDIQSMENNGLQDNINDHIGTCCLIIY